MATTRTSKMDIDLSFYGILMSGETFLILDEPKAFTDFVNSSACKHLQTADTYEAFEASLLNDVKTRFKLDFVMKMIDVEDGSPVVAQDLYEHRHVHMVLTPLNSHYYSRKMH